MLRARLVLSCSTILAASLLVACGGDADLDDDAVRDGFAERAQAAYRDAGLSRAEDAAKGMPAGSCFVIDDEAVDAIAAEVDLEVTEVDPGYLQGPPEEEILQCALQVEGEKPTLDILVGTTQQSADDLVDGRLDSDDPPAILDDDADGLDDDDVAAFKESFTSDDFGTDDYIIAHYVHDGVWIGFGGLGSLVDEDEVFAALPVLVAQVERVLGG